MEIIEFNAGDPDLIDRSFALLTAAHDADTPENPDLPERFFRTLFTHTFPGRERHWFAAVKDGLAVGYARANFFTDENRELAMIEVVVHPDHRRQGIGTTLLAHVERFCAENGRTTLITGTPVFWEGGPERAEIGARPSNGAATRAR